MSNLAMKYLWDLGSRDPLREIFPTQKLVYCNALTNLIEIILKVGPQKQRNLIMFVKEIVLRPPLKGGGKLCRRVCHLS